MTDPIISVDELTAHDGPMGLADVRWYLDEPSRGHFAYHAGHLPGALYVSLDLHLSAPTGPGRHPLPDREEFAATMSRLGFGDDQLIVAYDDRGGAIAARLWWMLRDIGHSQVRVLDGGIPNWVAAGHSVETTLPTPTPVTMSVRPGETKRIDRAELAARLGSMNLLDARDAERYRGDEEPVDPAAGHIPTARSAPMTENLAADDTFLDSRRLEARFLSLGVSAVEETVVYCGSGVTACHNAMAMVRAGLPEPTLYPGSWSDWATSGMPVAVGPEPGSA